MRKFSFLIFTVSILIFVAVLFMAHNEPSTEVLEKDLSELRTAIESADLDAAQYSGGIIFLQIQLRKNSLMATEAMLIQKRKSILRKVDLIYTIEARKILPASDEQLAAINSDMLAMQAKIKLMQNEAAQYRGGLILSALLLNIETQKITLANLQHKYYTAKYGIPISAFSEDLNKEKKAPIGMAVEDKDAL